MKKRKIYVVMASQGEYSDRSEWPVIAYEDETQAKAEVERRAALCREWQAKINAIGKMPMQHDTPESDAWWAKRDRLRKRAAKLTGGSEYRDPDDMSYFLCAIPLALPSPPEKE